MFTKDYFTCSICGLTKYSIDEYVTHMLQEENCILDLQTSSVVKDLLLPRFKYKNDNCDDKNVHSSSRSIDEKHSDLSLSTQITSLDELSNVQNKFAIEIETGSGTRWKCRLCLLTFTRQAAHLNHFRLQHGMKQELDNVGEGPCNALVKVEPQEINMSIKGKLQPQASDNEKFKIPEVNMSILKKREPPQACHICGQIFKTEKILSQHIGTVHSKKRPFICEINLCNMAFNTKGSLTRHQRRHTGERPYECSQCSRKFRESGSLLRHYQSRLSCGGKSVKKIGRYGVTLPFVNVISDSKADCKLGLKVEEPSSFHEDSINSVLPGLASNLTEETKATVQLQIESSEQQGPSPICSNPQKKCDQVYKEKPQLLNLKNLKKELILHDDSKEGKKSELLSDVKPATQIWRRTFKCAMCYKVYRKESYLSYHLKSHLVLLNKECSTCHKKFTSDHALARHLVCHSTAKQFECNICGKSFKLKSHAQSHLNSHSDEKNVLCPECGGHFKTVSSRNNHMKIHFGERNFECVVCYKKFLVKASLDRHFRTHSQERPFKCSYCQQCFKEQGTLSRHIRNNELCSQSLQLENKEELDGNEDQEINNANKISNEESSETLTEINDTLSENGSELESYLSEKVDISSIYSDPSDASFEPEEYLVPSGFSHFKPFYNDDIDMENSIKESIEVLAQNEDLSNS